MISTIQLKRGLAHHEPTFMAISVVEAEGSTKLVPIEIQVLEEFRGVIPDSIPKTLPPRMGINHEIK